MFGSERESTVLRVTQLCLPRLSLPTRCWADSAHPARMPGGMPWQALTLGLELFLSLPHTPLPALGTHLLLDKPSFSSVSLGSMSLELWRKGTCCPTAPPTMAIYPKELRKIKECWPSGKVNTHTHTHTHTLMLLRSRAGGSGKGRSASWGKADREETLFKQSSAPTQTE